MLVIITWTDLTHLQDHSCWESTSRLPPKQRGHWCRALGIWIWDYGKEASFYSRRVKWYRGIWDGPWKGKRFGHLEMVGSRRRKPLLYSERTTWAEQNLNLWNWHRNAGWFHLSGHWMDETKTERQMWKHVRSVDKLWRHVNVKLLVFDLPYRQMGELLRIFRHPALSSAIM